MRILHLASSNRWTGAAAPAFAEAASLRSVGVEAHYAYIGRYLLESRLRGVSFAHPILLKSQDPLSFARTVLAVRQLASAMRTEVIHAHLTYDHAVALAAAPRGVRVARTFHSRKAMRRDPLMHWMLDRTNVVAAVNSAMASEPLNGRELVFTPPPVDTSEFTIDGATARTRYAIGSDELVVGCIGKVAKGRGFEEVLRTFAQLRRARAARLIIIGHGPHQAALEALAHDLGITADVLWAGYHERELASHYRAMDLFLFTAPGSDEGHRALLEVMACGVTPVTYPIEGVNALLGEHATELIAPASTASAAAELLARAAEVRSPEQREKMRLRARHFDYRSSGERLLDLYGQRP